LCLFQTIDVTI